MQFHRSQCRGGILAAMTISTSVALAQDAATPDAAEPIGVTVPADFVEFTTADPTTRLKAPADWQRLDTKGRAALVLASPDREEVLTVGVTPRQPGQTLDTLPKDAHKTLSGLANFQFVRGGFVRLDAGVAYRIECTADIQAGVSRRFTQFILIAEEKVFVILNIAPPALDGAAFAGVMASLNPKAPPKADAGPPAKAPPAVPPTSFRIAVPTGWKDTKPDTPSTVFWLLRGHTDWRKASGMIKVDVGRPVLPTAKETAAQLAGPDGKVSGAPVDVDGTPGVRFETTAADINRPRAGVVIYRDNRAYLVFAAASAGNDIAADLDALLKSWKWSPPAAQAAAPPPAPLVARGEPRRFDPAIALKPPTGAASVEQLKKIEAGWQKAKGRPASILPAMKGQSARRPDGVLLTQGQSIESAAPYAGPLTYRIVLCSQGNDVRIGHIARQMIFNWEMNSAEFRIDGGPASGQHKPGAGELPINEWVGLEFVSTADELVVYVNGQERYRAKGDFTQPAAPVRVRSHTGSVLVKSVVVVR
jgi:hypothetical protein